MNENVVWVRIVGEREEWEMPLYLDDRLSVSDSGEETVRLEIIKALQNNPLFHFEGLHP